MNISHEQLLRLLTKKLGKPGREGNEGSLNFMYYYYRNGEAWLSIFIKLSVLAKGGSYYVHHVDVYSDTPTKPAIVDQIAKLCGFSVPEKPVKENTVDTPYMWHLV